MFGFFKRKKVPQWASFMEKKQYEKFMDALTAFLESNGAPSYKIDDGVLLFYDESPFGLEQAGLQNLAQTCATQMPENYSVIMADHFDSLKKTAEFFQNFETELQDFDKVKGYIGLRIHGEEYISQVRERAVFREYGEELYGQLVFDLPDSVRSLHPDEAAHWQRTEDELFELARANIRHNYSVEKNWYEHSGSGFWIIGADHFFSPNVILDLEENEDWLGSQGALVGVPNRHGVLLHPINSLKVVNIIGAMASACASMYNSGPGSISPNLFWYKGKSFIRLPYAINKDKTEFYPPDLFTDMLNELSEADS